MLNRSSGARTQALGELTAMAIVGVTLEARECHVVATAQMATHKVVELLDDAGVAVKVASV